MAETKFKLWRVEFDSSTYVVARDKWTAERVAQRHANDAHTYAVEVRAGDLPYDDWADCLPYFEGDAPHEKTVGQLIAELPSKETHG